MTSIEAEGLLWLMMLLLLWFVSRLMEAFVTAAPCYLKKNRFLSRRQSAMLGLRLLRVLLLFVRLAVGIVMVPPLREE